MSSYFNSIPLVVVSLDLAKATDLNSYGTSLDTSFDLVEQDIIDINDDAEQWAIVSQEWAENPEDVEVAVGSYSSLHWAAKAAADVVLTNADVVTTNANVVITNADVVSTNADVVSTGLDATATAADKVATNADTAQVALDLIATNQDTLDTAADLVATNADASTTNADVVLTNADVVSTGLDSVATAADRVQTGLDATATAADVVSTNQDTLDTAADLVATNQDTIDTAADLVATNQDTLDTAADLVATNADVVSTGLDATATSADVVSTGDSAIAAALSEINAEAAYDSFDDRYLGAKASDPTLDNNGDALLTGALYWNSTVDEMRVYDSAAWIAAYLPASGYVTLNGTETLTNKTLTSPIINSPTGIVKGDVGLGNVDNTADVDKPVSTAAQNALNLKANIASPTFTGTVSGIDKTMVGLSNVDNTSDLNKPISTATQTALDTKLANIVEDITPQLGGNLDCNGKTFDESSYKQMADVSIGVGTHTHNYTTGDAEEVTATGDFTLAFSGFPTGLFCESYIYAVNWGAWTITPPVGLLFNDSTLPTFTTSGTDRVKITKDKDDIYSFAVDMLNMGTI